MELGGQVLTGTSPFSDLFIQIVPPVIIIRTLDSGKLKSGIKCAMATDGKYRESSDAVDSVVVDKDARETERVGGTKLEHSVSYESREDKEITIEWSV
jgi:hypothetical protein